MPKLGTKIVRSALIAALMITTAAQPIWAADKQSGFHAPQTSAEKWLNNVLKQAAGSETLNWYLLTGKKGSPQDKEFVKNYLSEEYVRENRSRQDNMVKENCGGEYKKGEICGMEDQNAIYCAQDKIGRLKYKVIAKESDRAIIEVYEGNSLMATYTLGIGKKNQIQAIQCN